MIDFLKDNWFNIITVAFSLFAIGFSYHTYKENKKLTKKQQFESIFFNMLNQLDKIVGNLTLNKVSGRDVFEYQYLNFEMVFIEGIFYDNIIENVNGIYAMDITPEEKEKRFNKLYPKINSTDVIKNRKVHFVGLKTVITNFGLTGFELVTQVNKFDHYFNYISLFIRKVDETDLEEKGKDGKKIKTDYINIIKAMLTPYELVYLFYYGLTLDGFKFKNLAEKYSIFEYFDFLLLANSMRDERFKLYSDKYHNDYFRFVTDNKDDKKKYSSSINKSTVVYL